MMRKIQHENIRSIAVQQEALNDIYAHFDEFHKSTVFKEECRSWFKDGKVKNRIYLWPGCVSPNFLGGLPPHLLFCYCGEANACHLFFSHADNPLPQDDQRS